MNNKGVLISLLTASLFLTIHGKVKMPHFFSDNMVIQSDTIAALWGEATPGGEIKVTTSRGEEATAKVDNHGKWEVGIKTPEASFDPLSITVTDLSDNDSLKFSNVLAGEVWIASGQSNMEMPLRGYWHQPIDGGGDEITFSRKNGKGIRFLNVPRKISYTPLEDFDATWEISNPENSAEFSALAWFFARYLKDIIEKPVGIINTSRGGTKVEAWVPEVILAKYPDRNYQAEKNNPEMQEWERVGVSYNAMLHPLAGYTARGFIWNQGESNVGGHDYYPDRMKDMVMYWREIWNNPDMQFYYVELPGWDYGNVDGTDAALFRESQLRAEKVIPGAHMICTSDLVFPDEPDDIHARNKKDIGKRLAASAATYSYGIKGIPHKYPTFKSVEFKGDKAEVWFNDMWQGFTPNENLQGFEVAGEDRRFYPANAELDRNKLSITVIAPEVKDIKAVRYCFKNFAIGKIHDMLGMPIVPFRTDNW